MDHTTTNAPSLAKNKHRLYESLGKIFVSFNALEQGINELIQCRLDESATHRNLQEHISFREKIALMEELIHTIYSKQELNGFNQTLIALVERCRYCEQERNRWLQARWASELETDEGIVMRIEHAGSMGNLKLVPCSLNELENVVILLKATLAYVSRFHRKLAANKPVRQISTLASRAKQLHLVNGTVV